MNAMFSHLIYAFLSQIELGSHSLAGNGRVTGFIRQKFPYGNVGQMPKDRDLKAVFYSSVVY